MSERDELAIVLSFASGRHELDGGAVPPHGALPIRGQRGFEAFGDELLRVTGGRRPKQVLLPQLPPFQEAADVMLKHAGLGDGQVELRTQEVPMSGRDPVMERDAVYAAIRHGEGMQLLLVLPEVATLILCGNTRLSRSEAEEVICSGVVAAGFKLSRQTQRRDGPRGRVMIDPPTTSLTMVSYGTNPHDFSLDTTSYERHA